MATNQTPPNVPHPADLLNALLDRGYVDATAQVLRSIARDSESGATGASLKAFEDHAKDLNERGLSMSADDAYLKALMSDFKGSLQKDAVLIDAAAPDVQNIGIDAAGQFVRQTAGLGAGAQIGVAWNHVDPEAVRALVSYTTSDAWKAKLDTFQTGISQHVMEIAIRGIVAGQSPLTTAADIRHAIENLPAYQSNSIMRTLQIRSFQGASAANQLANADILEVQIRIASLDDRCCLSCIALHGSEVPLGQPIDDHEQGRCTSVTQIKGLPPLNIMTGTDWFNSLPETRQLEIAGPGALDLLNSGKATLQDFVHPYEDDLWGQMIREATLEMVRQKNGIGVQ